MKSNKYLRVSILGIICLGFFTINAQNSWVFFNNKCSNTKDYFKANVCENYINQLKNDGIIIIGKSRWLNAVCVPKTYNEQVKLYPFVSHVSSMNKYTYQNYSKDEDYSYGYSDWQLNMINLDKYHELGNTGKNINLALFDGGFWKVDSLPIFDSLWSNNQIIATRDFVNNRDMNFNQSTHGMQVLALAGINYPDSMMGAAPKANFVLARTENTASETHLEELNWLNALEWADSIGVDIIHSSLGYSLFDTLQGDYSYEDMDGKSTIITIAAQLATERGIFVTNSAGNSGNMPWHHITAPCDGKDVLCVGAVDSFRQITSFSSRGPSSDGRIKPELCAMGRNNTIPNAKGILRTGSGTSFSGPIIAGMVACLMSKHTDKSNQQIFEAILKSCHKYNIPDFEYGYGIPDVLKADSILNNIPSVGISKINSLRLSVTPNPVSDILKIQSEPESKYTLTNHLGMVVKSGTIHNWINFIDISEFSKGIYTFKVINGIRNSSKKIILK